MMSGLESERLLLRPLQLADAVQVQRIFFHWEVVRHQSGVQRLCPDDDALSYYRDFALPAIELGDEWHWSPRPKSAPEQVKVRYH